MIPRLPCLLLALLLSYPDTPTTEIYTLSLHDALPICTQAERIVKALPFGGVLYQGAFQRNDFTYGVAMFQRGYLEQAASSFKQEIGRAHSELQSRFDLVCRLLLEKKKRIP